MCDWVIYIYVIYDRKGVALQWTVLYKIVGDRVGGMSCVHVVVSTLSLNKRLTFPRAPSLSHPLEWHLHSNVYSISCCRVQTYELCVHLQLVTHIVCVTFVLRRADPCEFANSLTNTNTRNTNHDKYASKICLSAAALVNLSCAMRMRYASFSPVDDQMGALGVAVCGDDAIRVCVCTAANSLRECTFVSECTQMYAMCL